MKAKASDILFAAALAVEEEHEANESCIGGCLAISDAYANLAKIKSIYNLISAYNLAHEYYDLFKPSYVEVYWFISPREYHMSEQNKRDEQEYRIFALTMAAYMAYADGN